VTEHGALLDALRAVRWPARRAVRGGASGAHAARSRGTSVELSEYRAYRQGDDPRRIDWKLLARSDRAFVRLSPDHAVLPTLVVVDASASMDFPAGAGKWAQARRLAVGLAAVAHGQGDPVGLAIAGSDAPGGLPPRTRRGVVAQVARVLDEVRPGGSGALAPLVRRSTAGRVVLLTDLLGDADDARGAAAHAAVAGAEVHVVHLVARAELEPAHEAMLAVDPEDAAVRRPLTPASRAAYLDAFGAWREAEAARWRAIGAVLTVVTDDEAPDRAVRRVVAARAGDAAQQARPDVASRAR
jgi:uncharacterized protein (DUF58 family)